jgi:hypothetical protein
MRTTDALDAVMTSMIAHVRSFASDPAERDPALARTAR